MSLRLTALQQVDTLISSWTSKYQYHISPISETNNTIK